MAKLKLGNMQGLINHHQERRGIMKTHDSILRSDTAKQYRKIRKILKSFGYLKPVKKQTERDKIIKEGRV